MQALKKLLSDTSRLQRLGALSRLCNREISTLQSLACSNDAELGLHSRIPDIQQHGQCAAAAIDRVAWRCFGTSASASAGGDGGSSDSRKRRAREAASSSDEDIETNEEEPVDSEVELSAARAAAQASAAQASAAEQQPATGSSDGPLGDIPPMLQGFDLGNRTKQKFVLEQILRGKIDVFGKPQYFPEALDREDAMQEWLSFFRAKVVDVNRTSRGSPTGGIGRFSAMVVVGNSNGVIGLGVGKSEAMGDAIKKAKNQALKTLFFVPRYNKSTILHPVIARYGKVKLIMYPRSTGAGCKASHMVSSICQLVGIQDIGVKVHGTRNVRNMVKALIRGFESQFIDQEQQAIPSTVREERVMKAMQAALASRQPGPALEL